MRDRIVKAFLWPTGHDHETSLSPLRGWQKLTRVFGRMRVPCLLGWDVRLELLRANIERIVIQPCRETAKPFARAEVVATGKGLLRRVAFVVAGARFELWARPALDFEFLVTY